MVETRRWQIDSNWRRTAYFAAFQTPLRLAARSAFMDKYFWASIATSAFGFLLNLGWILNDRKTGAYTDYWRRAAESIEDNLPLRFVSKSEYRKKALAWDVRIACPKYSYLMLFVRLLFTIDSIDSTERNRYRT
jgi:hypothetical protein